MGTSAAAWANRIVTLPSTGSRLTGDDHLARQIDELERLSSEERDRRLGTNWIRDQKDFYNLVFPNATANMTPTFRPRINVPELQTLILNEATDLTDTDPKIYILDGDGKRQQEREKAYQANWRQGLYNNRLLEAIIWSMLTNVGWLQPGLNANARGGRGAIWLEARDPESVFPDPCCISSKNWSWLIIEDYMYIDDVKRMWPRGSLVRPRYSAARFEDYGASFQLPPGPMSASGSLPNQKIYNDSRVKVRTLFIFDTAIEAIPDALGTSTDTNLLVPPQFRHKYPGGRMITECEGVILADGINWCPKLPDDELGTFPLVDIHSIPSLYTIWGPPPVKYSNGLQETAERMYSQVFENAVRLNNGVWFIHDDTGIDIDSFGGLPGEVQIIHQGSQVPQMVWPKEMPEHFTKLPELLMAKQKQLQGFTPARVGEQAQGNISSDLADTSIYQSQYLTRLRGRLMAEAVQRVAQIVYYMMARFLRQDTIFVNLKPGQGGIETHKWTPSESPDAHEVYLDPGSISPLSGAALRTLVLGLAKANQIPNKYLLEMLNIPNAAEISEEVEREMALSAMAKLKRPR